MALPINIDSLIHGESIEWERLEFKEGWNPEDIIHSMCAFANDLNNWGGGYIIIGIAEQSGNPILPPSGVLQNKIDAIQGEIIQLGYRIQPNYFPITQPYIIDGKFIIVLWCPAGDNRPYNAPTSLGSNSQRQAYVRVGSRSIIAAGETFRRLQEVTARIPFDDRINNLATIQDLDLGLIQAHLQEIKSDLYNLSTSLPFNDLCRTMLIAKGTNEDLRPVNVGLLFFCKDIERFFPWCRIEVVWHEDFSGKKFQEIYFKGPIQKQLRDTLSFLQTNIIKELVVKQSNTAEAHRFYNYPYDAIEEALSNAVYHKSYELGSPIEIQIFPDKITILSHPGPIPPVNAHILSTQKQIIAREYRNRRIGDFLKELRLTEGRGTGFPTIYRAMDINGSPVPIFDTDEQTYVLVTLPIHPEAINNKANNQDKDISFRSLEDIITFINQANNQVSNQVTTQASNQARAIVSHTVHNKVTDILSQASYWIKRDDLFKKVGLSNQTANRKRYLDPLIDIGWISMEFPKAKTHPNQRYKITEAGLKIIKLIGL